MSPAQRLMRKWLQEGSLPEARVLPDGSCCVDPARLLKAAQKEEPSVTLEELENELRACGGRRRDA